MEIEVKLRLRDSASHQKLSSVLSQFHIQTLFQDNLFFDGPNSELTSNLAALRLRFLAADASLRCRLTLKSAPVISAGVSRAAELEEPFDVDAARAAAADPSRLLAAAESSEILRRVRDTYGVGELVCLGGFKNVRSVYDWEGLRLELDETVYEFGTSYEVECESSEPESVKLALERLLVVNGIEYCYSRASKFEVFRSRKLPDWTTSL